MLEQVRQRMEFWYGLNRVQRMLVVGIPAALLIAIVLWLALNNDPAEQTPLFTGLTAQDAGEIAARLDEMAVPYSIGPDGRSILVSSSDVYRIRINLAAEGLPMGGVVGFESMEETSFGATDFDRHVRYLRALQGELTRSILQIKGVQNARVHINLPEERLFVRDQRPATAAVLLELDPNIALDPAQVRGIAHLVSASVEGLDPNDVTILDELGRVLSRGADQPDQPGSVSSSLVEVQTRFQDDLGESVQSLLEQVLGPGNVVVRVNAEMNFDQTTIERSLLEPLDGGENSGFPQSVRELEERFEGTGGNLAGGVPGDISNIPTVAAGAVGGDSNYERVETETVYDYNRVVERTVVAPGSVRRLSVAVVVNDDTLTPMDEQAIAATVSSAIGLDPAREDQISVVGRRFDRTFLDAFADPEETSPQPTPPERSASEPMSVIWAGAVLGVALVSGLYLYMRRRRKQKEIEEEEIAAAELVLAQRSLELAEGSPYQAPSPGREKVVQLARKRPQDVALIVKAWLAEE